MNGREKLIDLLNDGCNSCEKAGDKSITEFLADYLIENGVVLVDTNCVKRENLPLIQQAFNMTFDELAQLVEAKQSGKFAELPCKIGDMVYSIWQDDDGNLQIDETEIVDVSIHKIWVNGGGFDVDCLGKSDFLSREDAEKEISRRCKR